LLWFWESTRPFVVLGYGQRAAAEEDGVAYAAYLSLRTLAAVSEAVRADLGINTWADLVRRVKAEPDKWNCALPGIGTTPHLAAEVLKLRADMPLQLVPFAGAGPAVQSILSGSTQAIIASQGGQVEIATRNGTLKLLAQTGATRNPDMPDTPTLGELGIRDAESETFEPRAAVP
jgi:tripartite-type tricarboxylate transporter receptor subunit TctC